jgi:hypothetical protein
VSIVEISAFSLLPGADEQAFLASDRRVQTELVPIQPGFMRRTTARGDGGWLVVTLWYSRENASAFDAVADGHPVQVEFEGHIDPTSVRTKRFETLD